MFPSTLRGELEVEAIKNAISQIESIEEFTKATSGLLPFMKSTSHTFTRIEPTDAQWETHTRSC